MVSYEHVLQNDIMVLFNDLQKYSVRDGVTIL